jgi:hypothetical protein
MTTARSITPTMCVCARSAPKVRGGENGDRQNHQTAVGVEKHTQAVAALLRLLCCCVVLRVVVVVVVTTTSRSTTTTGVTA